MRVGVVDDNPALGGQIWRGEHTTSSSDSEASEWIRRASSSGIEFTPGVRVVDELQPGILRGESSTGYLDIGYRKLVLATGAKERFLPFPGWTLLNVMGAGALQSLAKGGLPVQGKRVLVAGTGPLLLAVAAYLRRAGAEVLLICEQASRMSLTRFSAGLARHRDKIAQALTLRSHLSGVPLWTSAWPVSAEGDEVLKFVVISHRGATKKIECDYLACGFHLVPNTELATLMGCRVDDGCVQVDELQRTSRTDVFCAGEPTGIGGVELALVEGQIAGFAAAGHEYRAQRLIRTRGKLRAFAKALNQTFALRPELRKLPLPQTVVCRCEDVTYQQLASHRSWRSAKLQTRCGMGPCQGRVCGPATEFLLHWSPDSVRPPVFPVNVSTLSGILDLQAEPIGTMRGQP